MKSAWKIATYIDIACQITKYLLWNNLTFTEALHLVSTAATHANDAMKRIEKFKKLLEVQESLGGTVDLVSPTRELLKEGKIVKISARSGDHQDRYLFLVLLSFLRQFWALITQFANISVQRSLTTVFCPVNHESSHQRRQRHLPAARQIRSW